MTFRQRAFLLTTVIFALLLIAVPRTDATDDAHAAIERAWELAQTSGSFSFRSLATQTTTPAPALRNATRNIEKTQIGVEGGVDQSADTLNLTLWQDGTFDPDTGIEVRVDGQEAFGRIGQGEWQPIENLADLFAPGGDPLNFLAGIANVEFAGADDRTLGETTLTFDRYTFDFDGVAYAQHMRGVLEQRLHDSGELPASISLQTPDVYQQTTGSGSLWLTPDGLPYRFSIDLELPNEADGDAISATITTDFTDYDTARIGRGVAGLWTNPQAWLTYRVVDLQLPQTLLPNVILSLSVALLFFVAIKLYHHRHFYATVVYLMIASMVFAPLLQGRDVQAYYAAQEPQPTEAETTQSAIRQAAAAASTPSWNPQQNPLELTVHTQTQSLNRAVLNDAVIEAVDSDGDGLFDADEEFYLTCNVSGDNCDGVADSKDTDGDGLSDGAEVNQLNTEPKLPDTDFDTITDTLEIAGFTINGVQWYLDPNAEDSNQDGLIDSAECTVINNTLDCPDTDGDGTPDVFDDDNDGDGLLDIDDASPLSVPETYDSDAPLALTIDNFTEGLPLGVELQIRPTNPRNLGYHNSVLDWPTGDTEGQITRHNATTFANTPSQFRDNSDFRSAYGDVRVTPMLEILIPYEAGHYGNLPILDAYQETDRDLGIPVGQWLDSGDLSPYSINVQSADAISGDLVAFVPLTVHKSNTGDTPIAFTGKMMYEPSQATWGAAHEYRLVWLVQMLTDVCTNESATGDCLAYTDQLQIVHVYQDEYELSGLTVSEEHGLDVGIIYESPSQNYDDAPIWGASWGIANIWLDGRDCDTSANGLCQGNGERDMTLDNMQDTIQSWDAGYSNIQVVQRSYPHQDFSTHIMMTDTVGILDTTFASYTDLTPTFMVAQEITSKLADLTDGEQAGQALTIDLAPLETQMLTGLSWAPYRHVAGEWTNYPIDTYLAKLESQLAVQDYYLPEDESEQAADEAEGKLIWAQIYYSMLYKGMINVVEVGDVTIWNITEDELPTFLTIDISASENKLGGIGWVNWSYFEILSATAGKLRDASKLVGKSEALSYSWYALKEAFSEFEGEYFRSGATTAKTTKISGKLVKGVTAFRVATGLTVIGIGLYAAGVASGNAEVVRAGTIVLAISQIVWQVQFTLTMLRNVNAALKAGQSFASAIKITAKFHNVGSAALVLGLLATWGTFAMALGNGANDALQPDSIAFNLLLAYAIAATIVSIIVFILDFIPLVGQLLTALLAIIDAILIVFGKTSLTERVTQWLADLLYDVDYSITNLSDEDRLEIEPSFVLFDPAQGIMVGNGLTITVGVTNNLIIGNGSAQDAVFAYDSGITPSDNSGSLVAGSLRDAYNFVTMLYDLDLPAHYGVTQIELNGLVLQEDVVDTINFNNAGINWRPSFYVNESLLVKYTGCWAISNDCTTEEIRDFVPIDIGNSLVFDVLPTTIDGLMSGVWSHDSEPPLPQMADRDNDGLSNDGTDPNDNVHDGDGDGLSDVWEVATRSDLGVSGSSADTDNDGLNDREEVILNTNPTLADSDGDGLSDYFEVKIGWPIKYTGLDGNDVLAWTWSNPLVADADLDGLDDFAEFTYGFTPHIATDPSIIHNLIQFDNLRVDEVGAPIALLNLDEPSGVDTFVDISDNGHHGACEQATCPALGVGRFGGSAEFDGTQQITIANSDDINLRAFDEKTISAWFNVDDATVSDRAQIIFEAGGGTNGMNLFVHDGTLYGGGWANGVWESFVSTPINSAEWRHATLTLHRDDGLTLYLDGSAVDNATAGELPLHNNGIGIGAVNGATRLNSGSSTAWNGFAGAIDQVVLYDVAVSAETAQSLATGAYNLNDLIVSPDSDVRYAALLTNTTSLAAQGILQATSSYVEPALNTPTAFFQFEEPDYQITFANDTGESSNVHCFDNDTCPTSTDEGPDGRGDALIFDGADDALIFPTLTYSQTEITLAFWLNVEALPTAGQRAYIIDTTSVITTALDIYLDSDGYLWFDIAGSPTLRMRHDCSYSSQNGIQCNTSDSNWTQPHRSTFQFDQAELGVWHHVLFSYNNPTSSKHVYIDKGIDSQSFSNPNLPDPNRPGMTIGGGTIGQKIDGTSVFNGRIDELVVYNDENFLISETNINRINHVYNGNYTIIPASSGVGDSYPAFLQTYTDEASLRSVAVVNGVDGDFLRCDSLDSCPAQGASGVNGEAVTFDGSDDYFAVQNFIDPADGQMSAAVWFYPTTNSANAGLVMQGNVVWLGIKPSGALYTSLGGSHLNSTNTYNLNQWNHALVSYDGTTVRLTLNGVETAQTRSVSSSVGDLNIGRINSNNYFTGVIDELMIFDSVVSAAALPFIRDMVYPALAIDDDLINFAVGAISSAEIAGTAHIDASIETSRYRLDQVVEAALVSPSEIPFTYEDDYGTELNFYLPFEEATGSTLFQDATNVNDAARCIGAACPLAGVPGVAGRGLYFDGINDSLDGGAGLDVQNTTNTMLSVWVKGDQGTVVDVPPIEFDFNGATFYVECANDDYPTTYNLPIDLPENVWTHIVLTLQKGDGGRGRVYINGQLEATVNTCLNQASSYGHDQRGTIGSNRYSGDPLRGFIDDVRLYSSGSTVYSAADVLALYGDTGPILQFNFDEESNALTYADSSSNQLVGIPTYTECAVLTLQSAEIVYGGIDVQFFLQWDGETIFIDSRESLQADPTLNIAFPICEDIEIDVAGITGFGAVRPTGTASIDIDSVGENSEFVSRGGTDTGITLTWHVGEKTILLPNPAPGTDGQIGRTALFDGDGVIELPSDAAVNQLADELTIMAWINPDELAGNQRIIAPSRTSSANGVGFGLSGSKLQFTTFNVQDIQTADGAVEADKWQHVAIAVAAGEARFYVDGALIHTATSVSAANVNNDDPLYIGGFADGWHGEIDELVVYRRALLAGEISSTYQRERRWYRDLSTSYVQVDSDLPTINFLSTQPYRTLTRTQLAVTAFDSTSYVTVLEFGLKVPNEAIFTWSTPARCSDAASTWCPIFTPAVEGAYELQFRAIDAVGNVTTSALHTLYFDDSPPTGNSGAYSDTWLTLADGAEVNEYVVSLSGAVQDPALSGTAISGSGVYSPSVQVGVYDVAGELVGTGSLQSAELNANIWSLDYLFHDLAPMGRFSVTVTASDQAFPTANSATWTQGTILIDGRPTMLDFNAWLAADVVTTTTSLTGTVSNQPAWAADQAVALYHFEEIDGTTVAPDSTLERSDGVCATDCPTLTTGQFGNALDFSAAAAWTAINAPIFRTDRAFTVAFWVNPDTLGVSQLVNIAGDSETLAIGIGATGEVEVALTTATDGVSVAADVLTLNTFHHIAASYDGTTLTLYHNGSPVAATANAISDPHDSSARTMQVGAEFDGQLDELMLFDKGIAGNLLVPLANTTARDLGHVDVWIEQVDFGSSRVAAADWVSATVLNPGASLSTWTAPLPTDVENFYRMHVRGIDADGRQTAEDVVWRSVIDDRAPRISLQSENFGLDAAKYTQVWYTVEDKFLDVDSLVHPCHDNTLEFGYDGVTGEINQISAICYFEGWGALNALVSACDLFGSCASDSADAPTNTPRFAPYNMLFEPLNYTTLPASAIGQPVTIRGGANSAAEIQFDEIEISVNGTLIYSTTDLAYTTTWTPTASGLYTITSEAISTPLAGDRLATRYIWIAPEPLGLTGQVTLNGSPALDGTALIVLVNGDPVTETTTTGGAYQVSVPAQDPLASERTGGEAGDVVSFRLAGFETAETTTWQAGANTTLDLSDSTFVIAITQTVPVTDDVAYIGQDGQTALVIDSWGFDMGATSVTITGNDSCSAGGFAVLSRCFDITPSPETHLNATLTFTFYEDQLNGQSCEEVQVYHEDDFGAWAALPVDPTYGVGGRICQDAPYDAPHSIRVAGVSDFSQFELRAASGVPTAVTMQDVAVTAATGVWLQMVGLLGLVYVTLRLGWRRR